MPWLSYHFAEELLDFLLPRADLLLERSWVFAFVILTGSLDSEGREGLCVRGKEDLRVGGITGRGVIPESRLNARPNGLEPASNGGVRAFLLVLEFMGGGDPLPLLAGRQRGELRVFGWFKKYGAYFVH